MNLAKDGVPDEHAANPGPMSATIYRRKASFETRALRGILAAAGCLIVVSALLGNAGSVLLSIAACLACVSRIERNYRHGAYGRVRAETIE
ncbi:MAG TPA: hypothetical protein VKQ29_07755 [Aliidongia sp.]|nr:hypothetical protein [Aliidongia sp.]